MIEPERDRPKGQLFEEAAGWFARMRGPDADASREEFEAWLARGALHRSAYNRAAEVFAMGKLLEEEETQARPPRRRLAAAAAVAAVCLVLGAGWIGLHQTAGENPIATVAGQGSGHVRPLELASSARAGAAYRLADGSLVTLAPASRLAVDIGPQARRLVLEAGESRFEVAHESRPFIVYAGGGSVTARGTIFDVALSPDRRVRVRLIEGVIDVAVPGPAPTARRKRLVAGQSTSFAMPASIGPAQRPESGGSPGQAAAAARDYDSARLGDLVDAANSGSQRPIRIPDSLADRHVSGRFRIDDTDLLADRLAALFGLTVDRSDPSMIVLKSR
jgi:transmembrane sensor